LAPVAAEALLVLSMTEFQDQIPHLEVLLQTVVDMVAIPASQVVRADKLLMDLLNRYPCLSVAEYRLMLEQTDQTKRVNQP
jgi:hypothetical protein